MKDLAKLFGFGVVFFTVVATAYGYMTNWHEVVGIPALYLSGGLCAMIAGYLHVTSQRVGPQPEDDPHPDVQDNAGEYGVFAPYSWWPLPLGFGLAILAVGLAVGPWLAFIGAGVVTMALLGWVFEFYRGEHAH